MYVAAGLVPDPVSTPGVPVAGKRSKTSDDEIELHDAPYIDMEGLPAVLTIDLDSSCSVREGVDALAAAGSIPYPSVISVNDLKGSSQMHWLLDWEHADRLPVAPGEELKHARWRLYREMMRSLTMLMGGDPLFQGRRMRNPWYKPLLGAGVRVFSLDGKAPWYDPAALGRAVKASGVWIPDSRVFARSRMRSCIISRTISEHAPSDDSETKLTAADFIAGAPLPVGFRNTRAYRRLYAAAMHGVDPGEVMAGLRFEGSFPKSERRMIIRQVRRAATRQGFSQGSEENTEPPHAGSLWRSLQASAQGRRSRRRTSMAAWISDTARKMAAKGHSHVTAAGRAAQRKALNIGVRRMCIRRMRCRGDIIDAYMTAADGAIMTDRMVSRHLLRLNGRTACVDEPLPEPSMRTVRTVRRELVSWALQAISFRKDALSPEFSRALADPAMQGRPGAWPTLVVRAAVSVGFLDVLHDAGLVMLPGDVTTPVVITKADDADRAFSQALRESGSQGETTDADPAVSPDEAASAYPAVSSLQPRRTARMRAHLAPALGVAASGRLGGCEPMLLFSSPPCAHPQRLRRACDIMNPVS